MKESLRKCGTGIKNFKCLHRPARMPGWVAQGCWTLAIGGKSITALILLRKRGSKVLVVKVREREFPPVEFII